MPHQSLLAKSVSCNLNEILVKMSDGVSSMKLLCIKRCNFKAKVFSARYISFKAKYSRLQSGF